MSCSGWRGHIAHMANTMTAQSRKLIDSPDTTRGKHCCADRPDQPDHQRGALSLRRAPTGDDGTAAGGFIEN